MSPRKQRAYVDFPRHTVKTLRGILKYCLQHAYCRSAVLLSDVSNYGQINKTLGHAAGDALMAAVARTIEVAARLGDMVARVSTSEIAVVLDGIADADEAAVIAGRIWRALQTPVVIEGHDIVPMLRTGIVVITVADRDPEIIMRDAASALTVAVASAELPFGVFNPELRQRAMERLHIETTLRHAVERNALRVVYQPIEQLSA